MNVLEKYKEQVEKKKFIQALLDYGWTNEDAEKAYAEYKNPKQTDHLELRLGFSGIHPETNTYRNTDRFMVSG